MSHPENLGQNEKAKSKKKRNGGKRNTGQSHRNIVNKFIQEIISRNTRIYKKL